MSDLLSMRGIVKQYPGVCALNAVDFDLKAGEVHCLVGENGAGKSTLMKVLAGAVRKDTGTITLGGSEVEIDSPSVGQKLGIGIIYQDFKLVDELTVAENIALGREGEGGSFLRLLNRKKEADEARTVLGLLGEAVNPEAKVGLLSVAQRQIVEIARALSRKTTILVMDEPSASLTDRELQTLFGIIRRLKTEGVGIIYISHRLDEVFEIADRITVLRDGKRILTAPASEVDRRSLIRHMVGRELDQEYPRVFFERKEEILRVEHLSTEFLRDVSFAVYRGEVFGVAGLVGAGRSSLAHVLFGSAGTFSGRISFNGVDYRPTSPAGAIRAGIGFLTEDRNRFGLIPSMNLRENISLSNLRDVLRGIVIDRTREAGVGKKYSDQLHIKAPSVETPVEALSGGNRQKVILARWLFTRSRLLLFDEPTAGIDVGAKREIYLLINDLVRQGVGIIMISSELPELLGMCDRIGVMCEGRMTGIVNRSEATQETILSLATVFSERRALAG